MTKGYINFIFILSIFFFCWLNQWKKIWLQLAFFLYFLLFNKNCWSLMKERAWSWNHLNMITYNVVIQKEPRPLILTPLVGTLCPTKVYVTIECSWVCGFCNKFDFYCLWVKTQDYFFIYNSKGQRLETVKPVSKQLEIDLQNLILGWNCL